MWITSDLSWAKQIEENCIKKANQKVGMLYRRFYEFCSTETLKCLYVAFVRPHLEYICYTPVWDPHLIKHTELLERQKSPKIRFEGMHEIAELIDNI